MNTKKRLWILSNVIAALFAILLVAIIAEKYHSYAPTANQLADLPAVNRYLHTWETEHHESNILLIPTGIFIQSLRFTSPHTVYLTGYIWQRVPQDEVQYAGVVFPEAHEVKQQVAYRHNEGKDTVIGWHVEAYVTHSFDYSQYPLDNKIIRLRLWPTDFYKPIILTPDLGSYVSIIPGSKFGLEQSINFEGYKILETFFRYDIPFYDTTFGISDYATANEYPDLHYNIVIKRNAIDPLIIHVLPLLLIVGLMFTRLIFLSIKVTYNMNDEIRLEAMLLFVVLLSHIQLRQMFSGFDILYIEYMYLIVYFLIAYLLFVTYLDVYSNAHPGALKWVRYENNLIPKIIFLPITFSLALLITIIIL